MNFNASRNVGHAGGLRKAKRVSDVNAMGAPSQPPTFTPAAPGFAPAAPGFAPAAPGFAPGYPAASTGPPPFQEGIQLDNSQGFGPEPTGGGMYGGVFPQSPMAPAQITSMLQQPVVQDMALQYGNQLAQQGKEAVQRELGRYVPISRLRYYFAVDTRYVLRKLLLIMFPFRHKEWMVQYSQEQPVQPRYDINAPDLYIPSMGYVTYVLLAGFMLGIQHRFSPEQIGMQASSALAYIIFEMILYLVTLYVTNTSTRLATLHLLAYSGYKYTAMIACLLAALLAGTTGYYTTLLYTSAALSYFLVKSLRVQVLAGGGGGGGGGAGGGAPDPAPAHYGYGSPNPYADGWSKPAGGGGTKRRVYFLLFVAITQPLLSWWLTYHLVPASTLPPPDLHLPPVR